MANGLILIIKYLADRLEENILVTIWKRRSLIWVLVLTDLKIRYKNSVLGFVWTFLEPLLLLGVLYLVFTNIFKYEIENYPLFLLLGLVFWYMFSRGTTMGMNSLISRSNLIQKIYFRREILVISSITTSLIMMIFEMGAFFVFMIIFGAAPSTLIIFFPLLLVALFVFTLGISFVLSILNVYFRDIQHIWGVILQAGFFISPIFYKLDVFPDEIANILRLNPLVGIIELSRALVINDVMPTTEMISYMITMTGIVFGIGYLSFKKMDKKFVERL